MKIEQLHKWDLTKQAAIELQTQLAKRIDLQEISNEINVVAGVDVAYSTTGDHACAGVILLDANSFEVIESFVFQSDFVFPYISGLFSFRELPAILGAFEKVSSPPDLVICDGHGIAHPRRFGLASHLGLLLNIPTIGCAKSTLLPSSGSLSTERGSTTDIKDGSNIVGKVVRTQDDVNPVYVSPGHKITLSESVRWVLHFCTDFRLPETTRRADHLVKTSLSHSKE